MNGAPIDLGAAPPGLRALGDVDPATPEGARETLERLDWLSDALTFTRDDVNRLVVALRGATDPTVRARIAGEAVDVVREHLHAWPAEYQAVIVDGG